MDHFESLYWICYNIASVSCFGCKTCGISGPQPGIEPTPLVLEGEVLTTEPLRKSPLWIFRRDLGTPYIQREPWSRVSASWGQLFKDPRVLPLSSLLAAPTLMSLVWQRPFLLWLKGKGPAQSLGFFPNYVHPYLLLETGQELIN